MNRYRASSTAVWTILLLAAAFCFAGEAWAEEKRVVAERVVMSDGEEGEHRVILVGDDGDVQRLEGDAFHWVHGDLDEDALLVSLRGMRGGFLGVQYSEMTPDLREHFGVPGDAGVMVSKVVEGGPADLAGVKVGDIITRVDDQEIESGHGLRSVVRDREEGDVVALEVYREGSSVTLSATLEKVEGVYHGAHRRVMVMRCPEGESCESRHLPHLEFHEQCEGLERCEVTITCEDEGDCTCRVNDDVIECPEGVGH